MGCCIVDLHFGLDFVRGLIPRSWVNEAAAPNEMITVDLKGRRK